MQERMRMMRSQAQIAYSMHRSLHVCISFSLPSRLHFLLFALWSPGPGVFPRVSHLCEAEKSGEKFVDSQGSRENSASDRLLKNAEPVKRHDNEAYISMQMVWKIR